MENILEKAKYFLMILIGLAYVGFGIMVIIKKWFLTNIESNMAWALGILLILYGLFRVYRAININKKGLSD